mmetsp:Transcript_16492/g.50496  ORF Transcript_16492/g.50496 Transcript_16492/m.50496 type:complete len:515 (-) Transcript_16492:846-2390(-)
MLRYATFSSDKDGLPTPAQVLVAAGGVPSPGVDSGASSPAGAAATTPMMGFPSGNVGGPAPQPVAAAVEEMNAKEKLDLVRDRVEELGAIEATLTGLDTAFDTSIERQRQVANSAVEMHEILQAKSNVFDPSTAAVLAQYRSVIQQIRSQLEGELLTPAELGICKQLENLLSQFRAAKVELATRRRAGSGLTDDDFVASLDQLKSDGSRLVHAALVHLMEMQIKGAQLQDAALTSLTSLSSQLAPVDDTLSFPKAADMSHGIAAAELTWTVDPPKTFGLFGGWGRRKAKTPAPDGIAPPTPDKTMRRPGGKDENDPPRSIFPRRNRNLGGRRMSGLGKSNLSSQETAGSFPRPVPVTPIGEDAFPRTAGDLGSGKPMPGIASDNMISSGTTGAFPRHEGAGMFPRTAVDVGTGKAMPGFGAGEVNSHAVESANPAWPTEAGGQERLGNDTAPLSGSSNKTRFSFFRRSKSGGASSSGEIADAPPAADYAPAAVDIAEGTSPIANESTAFDPVSS